MTKEPAPPTYALVGTKQLEDLIKNYFMLNQSVLLFEYLCSRSDFPLYLSARSACEVLRIKPETLDTCRRQRLIRPRIYRRQYLYSAYDLVALSCKLNQKRIQGMLGKLTHVSVK